MSPRPRGSQHKPYQRPDGVWVYRVDTGRITPRGTRERLTVSSKDKREATRKYRELMRRLARDDIPTPGTQGITVARWAEQWLPMHATQVRPKTYDTDRSLIRKWIVPTVGHRRLADLSPADLRAIRKAITDAGRSTTTAGTAHRVFVKMLHDARKERHTVPDYVFEADAPEKAANDRGEIPIDQALRILDVVSRRDDSARWVAALLYGVRQGEALGLEWSRVDFDRARIDLSWQLQYLPKKHSTPDGWEARHIDGRAWWTRPKSRAGQRVLPLVPFMRDVLLAAKSTWTPNPYDLVWTTNGKPIVDKDDRATWQAIQAEAGVSHPSGRPWHVHECRHSAATILLRLGTPEHVVAAILGQAVLVRTYAHHDLSDMMRALEGASQQLRLDDLARRIIAPPVSPMGHTVPTCGHGKNAPIGPVFFGAPVAHYPNGY